MKNLITGWCAYCGNHHKCGSLAELELSTERCHEQSLVLKIQRVEREGKITQHELDECRRKIAELEHPAPTVELVPDPCEGLVE